MRFATGKLSSAPLVYGRRGFVNQSRVGLSDRRPAPGVHALKTAALARVPRSSRPGVDWSAAQHMHARPGLSDKRLTGRLPFPNLPSSPGPSKRESA
eukprot:3490407-Alexandrium_andersonii.AAC.1